jgi:hypothetical protein
MLPYPAHCSTARPGHSSLMTTGTVPVLHAARISPLEALRE